MGSTLKGKNLLLEEQILSFKNQHTNEKGGRGGRHEFLFASLDEVTPFNGVYS